MADVLCPTCGKPNPANLDTCQFCQTPLPLVGSGDLPDWLGSLDGAEAAAPASDEAPDWLSRLGGFEGDASAPAPAAPAEDLPDWLGGTASDIQPAAWDSAPPTVAPAAPAEDLPAWLSGGSDSAESDWFNAGSAGSSAFAPEESSVFAEDENLDFSAPPAQGVGAFGSQSWEAAPAQESGPGPDWFLQSDQPAASLPEIEPADWLASASAPGDAATNEAVDWFSQLGGEQPGAQEAAPDWMGAFGGEESPAAEVGGPDWLSGLDASGPAVPAEAIPDWMGAPGVVEPPTAETGAAAADWLSGLDDTGASAPSESAPDWMGAFGAEEAPAAEAGAVAGWLSGLDDSAPAAPAAPDWMGALGAEETPAAEAGAAPDWLSSLGDSGAAAFSWDQPQEADSVSPFSGGLEATPAAGADFDWNSGGLGEAQPEADTFDFGGGISPFGAEPPPPAQKADAPLDDAPDWLRSLNADEAPAAPGYSAAEPASEAAFGGAFDASAPDWLSGMGDQGAGSGTPALIMDEEAAAFDRGELPAPTADTDFLASMPDWLSQVSAEEVEPVHEGEAEPTQGGLAQADLPTWLQAMRPVEAAAPQAFKDVSDGRVESVGPLAGLRGVLPAQLDLKNLHKPSVYSLKVELSADAQQRMETLQALVNSEALAAPGAARTASTRSPLLARLAIFLFLLVAVFGALFYGDVATPTTTNYFAPRTPLGDFYLIVNNVEPGSTVLLAIDYEPAFVSELEPAVQSLLQELAKRGIYLALVSTQPSGPVQAEYLLASARSAGVSSFSGLANLGYLPGGPAGLSALADDPARALPYTLANAQAWNNEHLNAEQGLSSFALVVVATDSAETARLWIEQVGPRLEQSGDGADGTGTPLLMITSAQAEPLARAYYHPSGGRVDGLIGGLQGAMLYQAQVGQPNPLENPYRASILMAVLLVLVGGLLTLRSMNAPTAATQPKAAPQPKSEGKK